MASSKQKSNWLPAFIASAQRCHNCSANRALLHEICAPCRRLKPCAACHATSEVTNYFYKPRDLRVTTLANGTTALLCAFHVPFAALPEPPTPEKAGISPPFPRVHCNKCGNRIKLYELIERDLYNDATGEFAWKKKYTCNEC